jgi:DHA1 family bicyclomycin/chloramphenicol resistance-like MFS transporter
MVKLVILLGVLNSFAPFSIDMYLAAFPAMAADMNTSFENIQLTLSVFFFGLAFGQLIYGPLSDSLGRRRPLLIGLVVYASAALALVFVREIHAFLALRFVQALGGCAGMVICRAVVRDTFDVAASAKVLTVVMAVQTIGPVAAPVGGAWLLTVAHWGAVFVFMAGLGLLALAWAFFVLKETLPEDRRVKTRPRALLSGIGGLLRERAFALPAVAGAVGGGSIFAFISASPYLLMSQYGFSSTQYGCAFAVLSIAVALVSQLNFVLLRRFSARAVLTGGLGVMCFFGSMSAACVAVMGFPGPLALQVMIFLSLMSLPMIVANATALAMAGSGKMAGLASSLLGVLQFSAAGLVSSLTGVMSAAADFSMGLIIALCGLAGFVVIRFSEAPGQP